MRFLKCLKNLFSKEIATISPTKEKPSKVDFSPVHFHSLAKKDGGYYFSQTTAYHADGKLKSKTIDDVFEFAYKMTFSAEGEHRNHRSGGDHRRRNGEIFANTFQGKIAECAACNYFYRFDNSVAPDFSVSKLGEWDSVDVTVMGKTFAVKSTKHYGQLLLLETKDWDYRGNYIPNLKQGVFSYDGIILIRLKPSCEEIMKKNRLLYVDSVDRNALYALISRETWTYNYVGFLSNSDLKAIIKRQQIIPKGAMLNGSTPMDAENYYVQAGDFRNIQDCDILFR